MVQSLTGFRIQNNGNLNNNEQIGAATEVNVYQDAAS